MMIAVVVTVIAVVVIVIVVVVVGVVVCGMTEGHLCTLPQRNRVAGGRS